MLKKAIAITSVAILVVMSAIILVVLNGGSSKVSASTPGDDGIVVEPPVVVADGEYLYSVKSLIEGSTVEVFKPKAPVIVEGGSQIKMTVYKEVGDKTIGLDTYEGRRLTRITANGVELEIIDEEYTYCITDAITADTEIIAYYEIASVKLTIRAESLTANKSAPSIGKVIEIAYNAVEKMYLYNTGVEGYASDEIGFDQYTGYTFSHYVVDGTIVKKDQLHKTANNNYMLSFRIRGDATITAYYR